MGLIWLQGLGRSNGMRRFRSGEPVIAAERWISNDCEGKDGIRVEIT